MSYSDHYIRKKTFRISESLWCFGAENETRTRDPNLGKVVLYQLSYFRILFSFGIAKVESFLKLPKFFEVFWEKCVIFVENHKND